MDENISAETRTGTDYWTPDYAADCLARWRASGLSMTRWCREQGLSMHRLSYWKNRDGAAGGDASENAGFVALCPPRPAAGQRDSGVAVALPGGPEVRLQRGFDQEVLRSALKALT